MVMQELVAGVRQFVERELSPQAAAVDRSGELPAALWGKLGEQGLTALAVPERWGGVEVDLETFGVCLELLGGACASTAWLLLAHTAAVRAIVSAGTDAQKERLLPELASGRWLGAAMVATEAGGGSNVPGIRTRATKTERGWTVDGAKEFISLAGRADLYLVLARTGEGHTALGCYLVEATDAGVGVGARESTLGLRGVPIGPLSFDGCQLSAERLLGAEDGGLRVMGATGSWGMYGAACAALGVAAKALEETTAYVKERVVGGHPLASLVGVQTTLGELNLELSGARARLAQCLAELDSVKKGPPLPLFQAKVAVTEAAVRVVDGCLPLYGAAGYTSALPIERRLRDVRAFTLHWGNNGVFMDTLRKAWLA